MKMDELEEYLSTMEKFFLREAELKKAIAGAEASAGDERLSEFCGHLIQKINGI